MKASPNTLEALADLQEIATLGDLRRVIAQTCLALARKEISATDVTAMAKAVDAVSASLMAEIALAKTRHELRTTGADLGKTVQFGQTLIGSGDA